MSIGADAIEVLKEQREKVGREIEYVFPSPNGGPICPDSVLNMLHRVLGRAGLLKSRFHDLCYTFATLALQNGVDIKTVSGILGHFSAGFALDTYAHVMICVFLGKFSISNICSILVVLVLSTCPACNVLKRGIQFRLNLVQRDLGEIQKQIVSVFSKSTFESRNHCI